MPLRIIRNDITKIKDKNILADLEKFIKENYVPESGITIDSAASDAKQKFNIAKYRSADRVFAARPPKENFTKFELEDEIKNAGKPFDEYLRSLMNKKEMTSVDVCRNGNIDRKYFSKLISNKITPSKQKLLSLAVSLKLNLDETTDLLKYMGYAFSNNDITDLIFKFYIQNERFDIYEINAVLFQYDQKLLFGDD